MSLVRRRCIATRRRGVRGGARARTSTPAGTAGARGHRAQRHRGRAASPAPGGRCASSSGWARRPVVVRCSPCCARGKGHDVAVRAAVASLRERFPELRLVIAGDGPDRAEIERLAAPLGDAARDRRPPRRRDGAARRHRHAAAPDARRRVPDGAARGDGRGLPIVATRGRRHPRDRRARAHRACWSPPPPQAERVAAAWRRLLETRPAPPARRRRPRALRAPVHRRAWAAAHARRSTRRRCRTGPDGRHEPEPGCAASARAALRGMFWAYGSYVGGRAADAGRDRDPGAAAHAGGVRPRRARAPLHVPARDAVRPGRLAGARDREEKDELEHAETVFVVERRHRRSCSRSSPRRSAPLAARLLRRAGLDRVCSPCSACASSSARSGATHFALAQKRIDFRSRTAAQLADVTVRGVDVRSRSRSPASAHGAS